MRGKSFIAVMAISRNHQYDDLRLVNRIDQAVFLGDAAAPLACSVTLELFRVTRACLRMCPQFLNQRFCLGKRFDVFRSQRQQIVNCILGIVDGVLRYPTLLRKSSSDSPGNIRYTSPCLACSSERSNLWKYSSRLISVGSDVSSRTTRRRYLATRWSAPSSSATMPKLRRISAFKDPICTVDITSVSLVSGRKGKYYFSTKQIKR